jgi:hypothetical protein
MRRLIDPPLPTLPSREPLPFVPASRHATPGLGSPPRVDDVPLDASRFNLIPPSLPGMNDGSQANAQDPLATLLMGDTSASTSAPSPAPFATSSHPPTLSQWAFTFVRMMSITLLVVLFIFRLEPRKYDTDLRELPLVARRERWSELTRSPDGSFSGVQQMVCSTVT